MKNMRGMTGIEILVVLALATLFTTMVVSMNGCTPKPINPICLQPGYEQSVICQIATKMGTTPEQMDDLLLDASLISVATKQVQAAQLRNSVTVVRTWLDERGQLTMGRVYAYLQARAGLDPALAMLLSRRLNQYMQVDPALLNLPFQPVDKAMVLKHLDHQMAQLQVL